MRGLHPLKPSRRENRKLLHAIGFQARTIRIITISQGANGIRDIPM